MGDDALDSLVEAIAIDEEDVPASEANDLNVGAQADDLESLASSDARMGLFHLDLVVEVIRDHHG